MLRAFLSFAETRSGHAGIGIASTLLFKSSGALSNGKACSCLLPLSRTSCFTSSISSLSQSRHWNSNVATEEGENSGSRRQNQRNNYRNAARHSNSNQNNAVLPPAFDIVHWNDTDISKGHLLRVLYRDSYVVLDYYQQSQVIMVPPGEKPPPRSARAERTVTVALPPGFVARLLAVLENKSTTANIQLRSTTAVLEPIPEKGTHYYRLKCSTVRQNISTSAVDSDIVGDSAVAESRTVSSPTTQGNTYQWEVEFDPAESLMFHRFLTQCLQYNTGFCRPVFSFP